MSGTHHARDPDGTGGVGDDRHVGGEAALDSIQGDQLLTGPGAPSHDFGTLEVGEIVRVHRLVQLEHHVVGRINHIVDGTNSHRRQPIRQPSRRGCDLHPPQHRTQKPGTACGILGSGSDAIDLGAEPILTPRRTDRIGGRAGNSGEPERNCEAVGEFSRDALVSQQIRPVGRDVEHQAVVG